MRRYPFRKKIRLPNAVYDQGHSFFVTINTYRRYPWFGLHSDLCQAAIQLLQNLSSLEALKIFAWCIMPDHIHLLVQGGNIVDSIRLFKGRLTPIARSISAERKLWQRSFYDHAIRKEESLHDVACYIWENPVRARIADKPSNYRWSGSEVWLDWREICNKGLN